jgi:hypothetical protein
VGQEIVLDLTKVKVAPLDRPTEEGIVASGGKADPFTVERVWAGPAGYYTEQWSLRDGRRVIYSSPPKMIFVRGMQSISTYKDLVEDLVSVEPGTYQLVFVVEGRLMGAVNVEVRPADVAVP